MLFFNFKFLYPFRSNTPRFSEPHGVIVKSEFTALQKQDKKQYRIMFYVFNIVILVEYSEHSYRATITTFFFLRKEFPPTFSLFL